MLLRTGKSTALHSFLGLAIGCSITLAVYGYQFGRSNHSVYLLDALHQSDPSLLANDWYTTGTLQYHAIFSSVSAALLRMGIIEPAFAGLYGLLVIAFHVAWRGIVRFLGGGDASYLLSVVLYHLCAAGTGLGMYQFFQDSSLLPSNIANVALLWGIWHWLSGCPFRAGTFIGIAGIFHLNHALIGSGMWVVINLLEWKRPLRKELIIGTLVALVPSALNIGLALNLKLQRSGAMPLDEFVDLYVRLRHPHHYDPSTWPAGIWLAMLLPTVAGLMLLRNRARRISGFFLLLNLVALFGAGAWYVSETLVQMSLYRFSIYVQLLGCAAAGVWMLEKIQSRPALNGFIAAGCTGIIAICLLRGPFFGVFRMPSDDPAYLQVCRWARNNLPPDAVLLVPPDEESMRFAGQRAIVVNFKCVPQLSAELSQWRDRFRDVLELESLATLPRGYDRTRHAIHQRYAELSFDQLRSAAQKYGARYILITRAIESPEAQLLFADPAREYFLYALRT